jgi:hypothetical protein
MAEQGEEGEMTLDLSAYFERFLDNISLGEPQVSRMNSAANTISAFLVDKCDVPTENVFLQGSYANQTAIEPVDGGDYDIDLVSICVEPDVSCDEALSELEALFRSDGRFKDRLKRKQPCVRLEYAEDDVGSFHVDVVPVRSTGNTTPPLEAPRRHEDWRGTAPAEYTDWCRQQGPLYRRTVMTMKRWRDEQQSVRNAIKSIVLQVLVSGCMPQVQDDAQRLALTIQALHGSLSQLTVPPVVTNPVLPSENLARSWSVESFLSFVKELAEAVEWSQTATATSDLVEAADAWRELLGDDFPIPEAEQLGLELLDINHAETPAQRGWTEAIDARYRVTIVASQQRGKRQQTRRPLEHNGPTVFQDHKLHFKAHITAPNHVEVWWQVANTGGHARSDGGLRGEIFKGRDLNKRPTPENENWESTKYTGSHLIRVLLVRDRQVVAESDWFRVNIWARGHSFHR